MKLAKVACCSIGITLAGCAAAYDETAVPMAQANYQLAFQQCIRQGKDGTFKNMTALNGCVMDAQLTMFKAIKFSEMGIFTVYRQRMDLLASDFDAGRITDKELISGAQTAYDDFESNVTQAVQINAERRQRAALALAAMGQSLQNAAAQQQAYRASLPKPVHCTSSTMGTFTSTDCY